MNISLSKKMIIEMCGSVSFKKGDSFYRTNKVQFNKYNSDECEAIVQGVEDFLVTVKRNKDGGFQAKCSCPTLASFQKDCQHIAAVLIAVQENQLNGFIPDVQKESDSKELTDELLTIFSDQPVRKSGQQLYFEKRKVLDLLFLCKLVPLEKGHQLLGIEVLIGSTPIQDIRGFLTYVKEGRSSDNSFASLYDPTIHCFQKKTDAVIRELIKVIDDEKVYVDTNGDKLNQISQEHSLLVTPSSWERIMPLLTKTPLVKLVYEEQTYEKIHLSDERLSLQFEFHKRDRDIYQLEVSGLSEVVVLHSYDVVLVEGKFIQLTDEDCMRLAELKRMLDTQTTNRVTIPEKQVHFFLEKVVPGLRKLGNVSISNEISRQLIESPLVAKLYLDRVKNRLLAGVEFHYGKVVVNPLEGREPQVSTMFIRDMDEENAILQIMEESSFAKTDSGYFLHNEELEYEFLYHVLPKLQKRVQLYATTAVRNRIFRGNASPRIKVKAQKERMNWLEFKFEIDEIPEKQIRDVLLALEEKRKYFRLRNGVLLSLETREFQEVKRFLNAIPEQKEDLESGLNMPFVQGLKLLDTIEDQNILDLEKSFRQFLQDIQNPSNLEIELPKKLETVLRDYQKNGYKWMKILASYGFGGILADDMGLGKTLQSIAFILSELSNIRKLKEPALVVCPSSLMYNWLSEIKRFAPDIQAIIVDGDKKERGNRRKAVEGTDVVIISYPLLRRDIAWFEQQPFHTVFYDEAQAFKNPTTQTAKSVKRIKARNRFALTGTPVENSLEELWSIFHIVFPELFMGLKEYSNLSKKQIARRIRPFLLRRLKEDVLKELPEKMESMERVELLPEQKKLYTAYLAKLRHETLKHLDKDTLRKNRIKILAGLTRLRQICCHPALFLDGYKESSAKFEQLLKIVEESKLAGRRVLIFSQFTKMLELIGRELAMQGQPFFYLDGRTGSEERVELCRRFNMGERDLFLISLKAGGTGLNLTGADTVILYDTWWNPAVEEQAADRAHRMGQDKVVQVIKLVAHGTIEEKMNELQEKKKHLIEEIIDSNGVASTTLTEEDIRDILMI